MLKSNEGEDTSGIASVSIFNTIRFQRGKERLNSMRSVFSIFVTIVLTVMLTLSVPTQALAQPEPLAVLPGLKGVFASSRPDNIGVKEGTLANCPASPNCVVSQGADAEHAIAPISYSTDRATARQNLIDILGVVPRTQIVEQRDNYILAESESRLMGFVDDSEFYFPEEEKVIQMRVSRSTGRIGSGRKPSPLWSKFVWPLQT